MDKKDLLIRIQAKERLTIIHVLNINYPYASFKVKEGNILFWSSENEQSQPTKSDLEKELETLKADWEKYDYARKRKLEYPAIKEQLDTIYHEGIDNWKTQILAIKTKYPKSE